MHFMDIVDTIFSVAAVLILLSYVVSDMLWLRVIAVIGGAGYIVGGFFMAAGAPGKISLLVFSSLNASINLFHCVRLLLDRVPVMLPNELKTIYYQAFRSLTPNEFRQLHALATPQLLEQGTQLTEKRTFFALSLLYYFWPSHSDHRQRAKCTPA